MEKLNTFLQQQDIMQIAPHAGDPWIANVYFVAENCKELYFVGNAKRLYGQQLQEDPVLAFATAWHSPTDFRDRKGVQGVGEAITITDTTELEQGLHLYHAKYPDSADRMTAEWIRTNDTKTSLWKITPRFIKFWSDSDYGPEGSEEFTF